MKDTFCCGDGGGRGSGHGHSVREYYLNGGWGETVLTYIRSGSGSAVFDGYGEGQGIKSTNANMDAASTAQLYQNNTGIN